MQLAMHLTMQLRCAIMLSISPSSRSSQISLHTQLYVLQKNDTVLPGCFAMPLLGFSCNRVLQVSKAQHRKLQHV